MVSMFPGPGMYDALPFALAQCFVEIPYNLFQCILFSCISYFMIGFQTNAGPVLELCLSPP